MNIPVAIDVRFERINAQERDGTRGAVHLTVNGELLCQQWTKDGFHRHPSGVSRVTVEDFHGAACKMCTNRLDGRADER